MDIQNLLQKQTVLMMKIMNIVHYSAQILDDILVGIIHECAPSLYNTELFLGLDLN